MNPSGSTRWSGVPVATQRRPIEPVFCGISGATSTICTSSPEADASPANGQLERVVGAGDRVPHELVVGRAQEARLVPAFLDARVEDVARSDPERRPVERLAALVVQDERESARRVA